MGHGATDVAERSIDMLLVGRSVVQIAQTGDRVRVDSMTGPPLRI